jgi:type II secretory pathway component HofQ
VVENNSRGQVVNLGSAGQPPAINTRKASTQVLIKEGERLIIGGVSQTTASSSIRKVPVLGDIPLVGALFRIRESFDQGRELVVFLTPRVLRASTPDRSPRDAP